MSLGLKTNSNVMLVMLFRVWPLWKRILILNILGKFPYPNKKLLIVPTKMTDVSAGSRTWFMITSCKMELVSSKTTLIMVKKDSAKAILKESFRKSKGIFFPKKESSI